MTSIQKDRDELKVARIYSNYAFSKFEHFRRNYKYIRNESGNQFVREIHCPIIVKSGNPKAISLSSNDQNDRTKYGLSILEKKNQDLL